MCLNFGKIGAIAPPSALGVLLPARVGSNFSDFKCVWLRHICRYRPSSLVNSKCIEFRRVKSRHKLRRGCLCYS
jgi:hypothetical protein